MIAKPFLRKCFAGFVNLDHRKDRLVSMTQELIRVGLIAERMPGKLPSEFPQSNFNRMRKRTPGAIGCMMSQLAIMKKAQKKGKHAFVMEDDLIFCDDFSERLDIIEDFTEGIDWDVIWLGGTVEINPPYWHGKTIGKDAELTEHPHFLRSFGAFSTHAYIVNKTSISEIGWRLQKNIHIMDGIDHGFIQIQPAFDCFTFVPGCVIQRDNRSDIGNGTTYFSGFKKLGAHWFQKRLQDFNPSTYNWGVAAK